MWGRGRRPRVCVTVAGAVEETKLAVVLILYSRFPEPLGMNFYCKSPAYNILQHT